MMRTFQGAKERKGGTLIHRLKPRGLKDSRLVHRLKPSEFESDVSKAKRQRRRRVPARRSGSAGQVQYRRNRRVTAKNDDAQQDAEKAVLRVPQLNRLYKA